MDAPRTIKVRGRFGSLLLKPLRWDAGRSAGWQLITAFAAWSYVVVLHWENDGLWYQGDSPRHATNGVFWWDFLTSGPTDPLTFALSYYARYPVINPVGWPPFFYLLEAVAYWLFGLSPFVAKGLVLSFMAAGTVYAVLWLRRWVAPAAGWGGILFALQPGIVIWANAVMLNVPAAALGTAALYHWRRWLEGSSRHLYAAAGLAAVTVLTYMPAAAVLLVMVVWALVEGRAGHLFSRRTLTVAGLAGLPVGLWALATSRWTGTYRSVAVDIGGYPLWTPDAWLFYPARLLSVVTLPVLVLAATALLVARSSGLGREVRRLGLAALIYYVWFSAIAVKEPRYILLLVLPVIGLAVLGTFGACQWLAGARTVVGSRLISGCLLMVVGYHLAAAPSIPVPRVAGFKELAQFVQETASGEHVFYDGNYNGVFTFYLRVGDPQFRRGVILGSKLLYATRIEPRFGSIERVASTADVIDRLRGRCGCRLLVVERQVATGMAALRAPFLLRQALLDEGLRLVRSFSVGTGDVTEVDVYEAPGWAGAPALVELPFPSIGAGVRYEAKPVER
jgi:hypothetical protein